MEPEGSLPRLRVPATCPYHEPDQSRMSLSHCLGRAKGLVEAQGTCIRLVTRPVFTAMRC